MEEVLAFWFGEPPADEADLKAKILRWFRGGPEFDREVTQRFRDTVEAAIRGELEVWAETPRGRLALVILLDQMARNIFRDHPHCYDGDARAQKLSLEAFDQGIDRELDVMERLFLSMPLLHAEDLTLQKRLSGIAVSLASGAPPLYQAVCNGQIEQSAKYMEVISRFGRFPHRNQLLGRTSTPEELEFLKSWRREA
ncbi:MAG TPA: DUF924 family protein [Polyangiaceae bacterium]